MTQRSRAFQSLEGLKIELAAVGQIALLVIGQRLLANTIDELLLLGLDVLDRLFPLGLLRLEALLFIALDGDGSFLVDGRVGKERLEREIVLLRELVVFVVVAARAGDRSPENRRAQRVHDVGGDLIFALHQIARVAVVRVEAEEPGGGQGLLIARRQFVAGDLLLQEARIGLVRIERLDHIVAITIGVGAGLIALETRAVGVAHEIEPATGLTFAIAGGRKQAVHQFFVGVRRSVVDEGGNLVRRRDDAPNVERGATNEGRAIRVRRRLQALGFELGENECVDRRARPLLLLDDRDELRPHGLPRIGESAGRRRGRGGSLRRRRLGWLLLRRGGDARAETLNIKTRYVCFIACFIFAPPSILFPYCFFRSRARQSPAISDH